MCTYLQDTYIISFFFCNGFVANNSKSSSYYTFEELKFVAELADISYRFILNFCPVQYFQVLRSKDGASRISTDKSAGMVL